MLLRFKKLRNSGCGTWLSFCLYATRQQINFSDSCIFRREHLLSDPQTKPLTSTMSGSNYGMAKAVYSCMLFRVVWGGWREINMSLYSPFITHSQLLNNLSRLKRGTWHHVQPAKTPVLSQAKWHSAYILHILIIWSTRLLWSNLHNVSPYILFRFIPFLLSCKRGREGDMLISLHPPHKTRNSMQL